MTNIFDDVSGWMLSLLYSIPGILLGLVFHEFAHAYAADKLGDNTPRLMGRISLNPLHHLDPVGTLMIMFAGFGWAKPVMTNPAKYRIKRYGFAIVGFAGPLMNFILATIFLIAFYAVAYFDLAANAGFLIQMLYSAAWINIVLGVFNLMPIPPLDGYNILKDLVLVRFFRSQTLWNYERYGMFILIAFIFGTRYLNVDIIDTVAGGIMSVIDSLFQLFLG